MRCLHSAMTCLISTDCLFGTYWTWLPARCAVYTQQWHVWFRLTVYLAHIGHDSLPDVLSALSNDMSDFDYQWLFIWHILDTTHCQMCCLHSAVTCLISTDCVFGTHWTWLTASYAVCTQHTLLLPGISTTAPDRNEKNDKNLNTSK